MTFIKSKFWLVVAIIAILLASFMFASAEHNGKQDAMVNVLQEQLEDTKHANQLLVDAAGQKPEITVAVPTEAPVVNNQPATPAPTAVSLRQAPSAARPSTVTSPAPTTTPRPAPTTTPPKPAPKPNPEPKCEIEVLGVCADPPPL